MPPYHQIQTTIRLDLPTLKRELERFRTFLCGIGISGKEIDRWLEEFQDTEKKDFVSVDDKIWTSITVDGESFQIRPFIMFYKKEEIEGLNQDWISYQLLFITEEITDDFLCGRYLINKIQRLWYLSISMFQAFPDSCVFLTDDISDNYPWYYLETKTGRNRGLWDFDLGIIPPLHYGYFVDVPKSMAIKKFPSFTAIADKEYWEILPWEKER